MINPTLGTAVSDNCKNGVSQNTLLALGSSPRYTFISFYAVNINLHPRLFVLPFTLYASFDLAWEWEFDPSFDVSVLAVAQSLLKQVRWAYWRETLQEPAWG